MANMARRKVIETSRSMFAVACLDCKLDSSDKDSKSGVLRIGYCCARLFQLKLT